jgi:hypothetical protein
MQTDDTQVSGFQKAMQTDDTQVSRFQKAMQTDDTQISSLQKAYTVIGTPALRKSLPNRSPTTHLSSSYPPKLKPRHFHPRNPIAYSLPMFSPSLLLSLLLYIQRYIRVELIEPQKKLHGHSLSALKNSHNKRVRDCQMHVLNAPLKALMIS